ncbi:MAG: response regulator transcription factor [Elusimicrobiota bacterium]|nr:response regulator transcription factor [Elusimicrobiota bacterium]
MAGKRNKVRVLIADDQTLFREGLKDILEGEKWIELVGEAADGEEAARLALELKPQLVLMDIKLPKLDGISAVKKIKEASNDISILMLSSFEDEAHVIDAVKAGANGYLSKMLPTVELLNSVRSFASKDAAILEASADELLKNLRKSGALNRDVEDFEKESRLSDKEIQVLDMVRAGLGNKQIADKLNMSIKTVKNHLNKIFGKLNVTSRTEAVVKAINLGIISSEK